MGIEALRRAELSVTSLQEYHQWIAQTPQAEAAGN
jgi:hypothetical protein